MASFVNSLQGIYNARMSVNESEADPTCVTKIDHYKFYQFTLIPALLITLAYSATKKRRNLMLNLLRGRPGMIFPMDSLTRSSRISYACAFGGTAFLVYKIVLEGTYAIEYDGNRALKSFIAIASMFIYGLVFFPVFASLALESVFSFAVGTLYVWALFGVEIFKLTECTMTVNTRILLVLRSLPSSLCLMYLAISMPFRVYTAFKKGKYFYWENEEQEDNELEDIRTSYSGHHVAKLFKKPVVKEPPVGCQQKFLATLRGIFYRLFYRRQRGFRYPSRIISVMFVAVIVVYVFTFQLMTTFPAIIELYRDGLLFYTEITIGIEPGFNESSEIGELRDILFIAWWAMGIVRVSLIVSTTLAMVFALMNVLHMLSSYRQNLYALYRGDYSHLPHASAYSNTSHCINSIKYAGFQVGYIIWSFAIQCGILWLITTIVAFAVYLIVNDFSEWAIFLIDLIWPVALTAIVVAVSQMLLAKFSFLQARGEVLALDNRGFYFNFTYFMFFYNIFLGLVSCLLRILKAMFVGIVFLSRLDNSTLPRRFEFLDPGFRAYVGYMHVEAAHTNPVVIVFTRIMMLGLHNKRLRMAAQEAKDNKLNNSNHSINTSNGKVNEAFSAATGDAPIKSEKDVELKFVGNANGGINMVTTEELDEKFGSEDERRRRLGARFNWHVVYTLLHNPDIRVYRKGYMQMLRQAKTLGVHIPVSDKQADVNFDKLQQDINDAKEKYANPPPKAKNGRRKSSLDTETDSEDGVKKDFDDIEAGLSPAKPSNGTTGNNSEQKAQIEAEVVAPEETPKREFVTSIKL